MRIVKDCKKSMHNLASYSPLPYSWKRNDIIIFICKEKSGKIGQSFPKVKENEEKWGGTSKVRTNEELGGTVGTLQISRFYLNVTSKFYFLHFISPPPSFPHLLCKKAKKHPVLYDQKNERYREKNIVSNLWNVGKKDLELTKNDNRKLILLFMLYLGWWIFQALKKIKRFALFTRNNNREGYLEPTIMGKIFGTK